MRRRRSRPLLYPPVLGLSHLLADMTQRSTSLTRSNGTPGRPNAYTTALWAGTINRLRNRIARVADRPSYRNPREQHEPDDEEGHQRDDRVPITPGHLVGDPEQQRAQPAHA